MFEDKDYGSALLKNPLAAQAAAIESIEERLNGVYRIADPNSPFCHLLEFGASMTAACTQKYEEGFRGLYATRAQTMDDLYKHMSDYDYLNLFSKPASTTVELMFNKDYLTQSALDENDLYKKVIIPRETVFTIGKYTFGLYYPITIRITKATGSVLTAYDTTVRNPLHTLTGNMVDTALISADDLTTQETEYSGLNILVLRFPIYQFARTDIKEDLITQVGFSKAYTLNQTFYAARLYTTVDGVKQELNQVLSADTYDMTTPTARVRVDLNNKQVRFDIPQIFFTEKKMGSTLTGEIYTTYGALDVDVSDIAFTAGMVNFNLSKEGISQYSKTLTNQAMITLRSAQAKITGGSNGYRFEELRDRIINDNFYKTVPVTPTDIQKFFSDAGFSVKKTYDGITDRVYTAYRALTDEADHPIPTAMVTVSVADNTIYNPADATTDRSVISTVRVCSDNSIVFLPTTLYAYSSTSQEAIPLNDSKRNALLSSLKIGDKLGVCDAFNRQQYTVSPFHLRVDRGSTPRATTYDLMVPSVVSYAFVAENTSIASTMVAYAFDLIHVGHGVGGYYLYLSVTRSADLKTVPVEDIVVYLHTVTSEKQIPGIRATYVKTVNDQDVYQVHLDTNYMIDDNGKLCFTSVAVNEIRTHYVDMESDWELTFLVKYPWLSSTALQAGYSVISGVPETYTNDFIALVRQTVKLHFGHAISDVLHCNVNTTYSKQQYKKYAYASYLKYTEDQYLCNEDGSLKIEVNDGIPKVTRIHKAGDYILAADMGDSELGLSYRKDYVTDIDGIPLDLDGDGAVTENDMGIVIHAVGDVMYDAYGDPYIQEERNLVYEVEMFQIDARVAYSEHPDQIAFYDGLPERVENYITTTRDIAPQLLEGTHLYFSPVRSMGKTKYSLGDSVTTVDSLTLTFSATLYVHPFVKKDTSLMEKIKEVVITDIEAALVTKKISMADIFNGIKYKMADYITSVDIHGINGDQNLQTLVLLDDEARASIAKTFIVNQDNLLVLEKQVNLEFVSHDTL